MGNEQTIKKIVPPKEIFEQICQKQESKQNPLIFSSKIFCDIFQELEAKGYILTSFIGQVGLGTIFEAQKGNEFFAIKCLITHNPDDIQKEINLLNQFKMNSSYFQTFKEGFYSEKCHIYFYIAEKLSCNLQKVQETYLSNNQQLCYYSILAIAIQISKGLCILEENNIYHNEVIPENIMYDSKLKTFKLGDVGISQIKKNIVIQQTHREIHKYFAPEKVKQIKEISLQSDIYSLGLILVELTCGRFLTVEETDLIRKGFLEQYLNQEESFKDLNQLIKQMLCINKANRFKPRELEEQLYSLQRIEEIKFQSVLSKKQKIPKLQQIKLLQQLQKSFQEVDINIKDQPEQLGLSVEKSFKEINLEIQNFEQQLVYRLCINAAENQIGQDGANKIGQILQRCQYLTNLSLNLQNNSLNAEAAKVISSNLQNLNNLINLKLNYNMNSIKSEGVNSIFKMLSCYKNLNILNVELEQNSIGADATKSISEFLEKCQNLRKLNLSLHNNQIGVDGAKNLAQGLENCKTITKLGLNLFFNQIQREGAQFICSSLEKCYNMIELNLDLGDNSIGLEGAKNIGYSIERCFSIQTLFLNLLLNDIGDEGAKSIGRSFERCKNITSLNLDLSGNQIGENGEQIISKCLSQCQWIKTLKIYV
ncbi:kinase domain protein (macronuclear) [Tetrahymena thermophila SB210]|uniref:Kinase domain protein n=1 Tax=Tetrahymena thermophila (strain SB210) TaxID=312017 RepID=Q22LN5_TETTS|nr:kinase domain protein [Tetrahymena thermophila SB210]EAR86231.3 kinase domain protein [Tetrahymena thermophila SB210]|eukprot:XP_976826.3 kinase domain protein [Tetrahymena thermophila SB210]